MRTVPLKTRCSAVAALSAILLVTLPTAFAQPFPTVSIETGIDAFGFDSHSIAIDDAGDILVAYQVPAGLKLARVTSTELLRDFLSEQEGVGGTPSIALDSFGYPNVAAHGQPGGPAGGMGIPRYTLDARPDFGITTVELFPEGDQDPPNVGLMSLALDSNDRPYVAFRVQQTIGVASFDILTGRWQLEQLPTTSSGLFVGPSCAISPADEPAVAYITRVAGEFVLRLSTRTADGWINRDHPLPDFLPASSAVSLAFDSTGAASVAFAGRNPDALRIARFGALGTTEQTIVEGAARLTSRALVFDSADRARLAYYREDEDALYLASNDFGWVQTELAADVGFNAKPTIARGPGNTWAVSYLDQTTDTACGRLRITGTAVPLFVPPADLNDDGVTDGGDLNLLLAAFEACDGDAQYLPVADLNGNGCIDGGDLNLLLAGGFD